MKAGVVVRAELDQLDALSVGLSLVTLAKRAKMPRETCEVYDRVGRQLIAAARVTEAEPTVASEVHS